MARIKGVDIPNDKHIVISLTYIYGIGRNLAKTICAKAGVEPTKKAGDLTQDELIKLRDEINSHLTEGDLRREVSMNIKTKMEINSYEGTRHKKGLPVRGQRTNRNARTRKGRGKTVANKKKA
ncbi:MAG: 30S ribosomal protein S13 [Bacilli bacterium]|nr:30S ribosomal protein S13 [Bacilli bacterium]